jgi:hypothetical protein
MNTTTGAVPYALSLTVKGTSGSLIHAAATALLVNLAAPQGVAADRTDTQAQLSWQASVGASSYSIERSLYPGGPYELVGCTNTLGFTDTGLNPATTYYYVITARYTGGPDAGGASAPSAEVSAVYVCPSPSYVGTMTASKSGFDDVTWSWSAGGASWYDVVRGDLDVLRTTGGDFAAAIDAIAAGEACVADDMSGIDLIDPYGAPAVDDTCEFVILRAVDTVCPAHGTYDEDMPHQPGSRDPGIDASSQECP